MSRYTLLCPRNNRLDLDESEHLPFLLSIVTQEKDKECFAQLAEGRLARTWDCLRISEGALRWLHTATAGHPAASDGRKLLMQPALKEAPTRYVVVTFSILNLVV